MDANPPRDGVMVPGWLVKAGAPIILGFAGWLATLVWSAREASVKTGYELQALRADVARLGDDRVTATQVRDALALRDQRITANEARISTLEEAERQRAAAAAVVRRR